MLTMQEAKSLGLAAAGQEFETPKGVVGRVLPELSPRGKLQAELTCATPGCVNTHIREVSDWHQCGFCRDCKKPAKSHGSGGGVVPSVGGGRSIKLEGGTILREMKVNETDDAELRELKEENNRLFEGLWAQQQADRDAKKAAEKAERDAKKADEKAYRDAKKAEEVKKATLAQARKAIEVARSMGVAVSPSLLKAAELAEEIGSEFV